MKDNEAVYGKINETKIIQGAQRLFFQQNGGRWFSYLTTTDQSQKQKKNMLYKGSIRIGRDGLKRTETFFSKMLDWLYLFIFFLEEHQKKKNSDTFEGDFFSMQRYW